MVNVSEMMGDQSGRPDTSGVDPVKAQDYARRMFEAVLIVNFPLCRQLHSELNQDWPLYTLANDQFKQLCKQRGLVRGGERFREYAHD